MVTSETPTFGVLLSRYRAAVGLTQEELAEQAGLSARGIGDLERGVRTRPRGYTVRQLAAALRLSPDDRALFEQAARVVEDTGTEVERLPEGTFLGAVPENSLVGREEERERIGSAIATVADGAGRLLLLGGEVGAGKTRLLQEIMLEATDRGFLVLTGRCSFAERSTPFYPFLQSLSELPARSPPNIRAECGRRWKRISRLMSGHALEDALTPNGVVGEHELCSAARDLVLLVARSTLLALLIDDLHWADARSLKLLEYLARASGKAPILLAGSFCDVHVVEQHPCLAQTLHDLGRERLAERITVRRLALDETTRLVAATMGQAHVSEEFASFVYRRTRGNPRLIDRLVRALGGRLELRGEIGAGSMGRVFRAVDRSTGNTVAAKLVLARSAVELDALLRWQQEGAVLAKLEHPHIIRVHGTFADEHASCIIMELLDGQSLGCILQDGRLPLHRARHLAAQVADALAYAHVQSIIHRDIKPDNVMVLPGDRVKVTDFGIARLVLPDRSVETVATTGMRMGTPLYMAPEQIGGKAIDGRADIYSLGAMLYHMVTGRPPFDDTDALAVIVRHLQEEPTPPSFIDPAIPAAWDALILRTLAKDPAKRFGTAAELREAIRSLPGEAVSDVPAALRSASGAVSQPMSRRPQRAWIATAAVAATLAVLALLFGVRLWHSPAARATAGARIDAYLHGLSARGRFSGVALVSQRGTTVLSHGYGMADRTGHRENSPTTRYPVPGVSYTMSIVAALRLEAQGRLSDRALICRYLPQCPGAWKRITIRAVLAGTARLPIVDRGLLTNRSPRQSLAACQAAPLALSPPEIAEHDNCAVVVLGTIFEQVSGKPWARFMRDMVLAPAGMRDSGRITDEVPSPGRAIDYSGNAVDPLTHFDDYFQIYSTAQDVAAYDNALFAGRLVSRQSLQRILAPGPGIPASDAGVENVRQGYGWRTGTSLGRRVTYTTDGIFSFTAANLHFPQDGVTVVVLSNESQDDVESIAVHVAHLLLRTSPRYRRSLKPQVLVVNPRNAILATVRTHTGVGAGAVVPGGLWSPSSDTGGIYHIDAVTGRVTTLTYGRQETINPQQNPNEALAVDGQVWATDRGGKSVVRIDPRTGRVMKRVPIGIHGQNMAGVRGTLWVSSFDDDAVVRVNLRTDMVVARLTNLGRPTDIAAGEGALWVTVKNSPEVIRINPTTNTVVTSISVGTDPQSVAVGSRAVWVNNGNGNELFRIDPASNRVVATIPLDRSAGTRTDQSCGCVSVAAVSGTVWAIAHNEHRLLRIDPRTNRVVAGLTIPAPPGKAPWSVWDVLAGGNRLWVDADPNYVYRIDPEAMAPGTAR